MIRLTMEHIVSGITYFVYIARIFAHHIHTFVHVKVNLESFIVAILIPFGEKNKTDGICVFRGNVSYTEHRRFGCFPHTNANIELNMEWIR